MEDFTNIYIVLMQNKSDKSLIMYKGLRHLITGVSDLN